MAPGRDVLMRSQPMPERGRPSDGFRGMRSLRHRSVRRRRGAAMEQVRGIEGGRGDAPPRHRLPGLPDRRRGGECVADLPAVRGSLMDEEAASKARHSEEWDLREPEVSWGGADRKSVV